jgi:hypothetical protein
MVAVVALALGALANTAEITSTNIRSGAAFDNIKATWNQALKLGDFNTNLKCNYDYSSNKDFLKDATLSGDLVEAASSDDVRVSYEVSHNFGDKKTNLKLTANTQGTTLGAEIDDRELTEVSAERDIDLAGKSINVQPSWLVKAKTARVKLMSRLGDSTDKVSAQVDYDTQGGDASYELGYEHRLEEGRDVSATFRPGNKDLDIEYVDNKFESGATWTATANVPLEQGGSSNILDAAKLSLKRSWSW